MRPSVEAIFPEFSASFEGRVPYLYCDVRGLVTTGVGNLMDPIATCLSLPWEIDGRSATDMEIGDQWTRVKGATALCERGGGAYATLTTMRISAAAIDALVRDKMYADEASLCQRIPNWALLPADAQLGTLSMAWACGPWFLFPRFMAAIRIADFATCAIECRMSEAGNPGLHPRNVANAKLFTAAHDLGNGDPDQIHGWG
jgi:GH24 family phage-related lysozyme (muramidase)